MEVEVILVHETFQADGHRLDAFGHVDGEVVVLTVADGGELGLGAVIH